MSALWFRTVAVLLGVIAMLVGVAILRLDHRVNRLEVIINGVFSGGNKVEPK